jgi:succinyl-CoA synthetase beta subunit
MLTPPPRADIAELIATARAQGHAVLSEPESKALLREIGIPIPSGYVVTSAAAAAEAAEAIGCPVVVKAVSRALTHKTDAGGIVFPIETPAAAVTACGLIAERVRRARPDVVLDGFLIEAFQPAKLEWILSLRIDPQFGPLIMFGLGGIFVELLGQVSFRLAPLSETDIGGLLAEKLVARALEGIRGDRPANRESLKGAIRALSDLGARSDISTEITEIEINPLIVTERGVLALDALILVRSRS